MALLKPGRGGQARPWDDKLARAVLRFAGVGQADRQRPRAHGVLLAFTFAERLATLGHHKRPLSEVGVLSYEIERFSGRPLSLGDGQRLNAGDRVVTLHWQNQYGVARLAGRSDGRQADIFRLAALARKDLRSLAHLARNAGLPPGVRAVWAETILYRSLALFGFKTRPAAPGLRARLLRIYFLGLLASYGLEGLDHARSARSAHYRLGEAWMSIDELCRRFPAEA